MFVWSTSNSNLIFFVFVLKVSICVYVKERKYLQVCKLSCVATSIRMDFLCLACIGNYKRKKWKDNRSKKTINKHLCRRVLCVCCLYFRISLSHSLSNLCCKSAWTLKWNFFFFFVRFVKIFALFCFAGAH